MFSMLKCDLWEMKTEPLYNSDHVLKPDFTLSRAKLLTKFAFYLCLLNPTQTKCKVNEVE
jgi:hypothetical protein